LPSSGLSCKRKSMQVANEATASAVRLSTAFKTKKRSPKSTELESQKIFGSQSLERTLIEGQASQFATSFKKLSVKCKKVRSKVTRTSYRSI